MSESEFWEMRISSYFLKLHYYKIKEREEIERAHNLCRLQTVALINIQLNKQHRITDPAKLWRFPWDEKKAEMDKKTIDTPLLSKLMQQL